MKIDTYSDIITIESFKQRMSQLGLSPEHNLLLACSGGSDSMCLVDLMLKAQYTFSIAHVNYGLRGNESDDDMMFVVSYCKENNIKYYTLDAKNLIETGNLQEQARNIRYRWFNDLQAIHRFDATLTAHHMNDQAETILLNITRGTGLDGLSGMSDINQNIARPLLVFTKKAILNYCIQNGINFRDDSSNNSNKYSRNYIRNHIITRLENINPRTVEHISSLSKKTSFYKYALQQLIENYNKKYKTRSAINADITYDFSTEVTVPYLPDYLFHELAPLGFNYSQIEMICNTLPFHSGKIATSHSHQITTQSNKIHLSRLSSEQQSSIRIDNFPFAFLSSDYSIEFKITERINADVMKNDSSLFLDISDTHTEFIIDYWKKGDSFKPYGMNGHKKLSDYFTDKKIPAHQRSVIPLLKINNQIAAVIPYTVSDNFKISEHSTKVLRIQCKKKTAGN